MPLLVGGCVWGLEARTIIGRSQGILPSDMCTQLAATQSPSLRMILAKSSSPSAVQEKPLIEAQLLELDFCSIIRDPAIIPPISFCVCLPYFDRATSPPHPSPEVLVVILKPRVAEPTGTHGGQSNPSRRVNGKMHEGLSWYCGRESPGSDQSPCSEIAPSLRTPPPPIEGG
ncbi:hypothetical protein HOY82DRAFT_285210 [Tuber indicum]|nr:hypothetical protein HOY82DRAFT_285210 [Tuber indicum]